MNLTTCTQSYSTLPVTALASLPVHCAWCLREQGEPMGGGSHGICEKHAARILAEHRARKQARQQ